MGGSTRSQKGGDLMDWETVSLITLYVSGAFWLIFLVLKRLDR